MSSTGFNWTEEHPRFLTDLTGDRRADVLGFGRDGVWVARNQGDGTFATPQRVLRDYATETGWRVAKHPRVLADLTGDGRPDLVGFGYESVWTALNNGDGTFQGARDVLWNFCEDAGGWRVAEHPRFLADITGDGRADIVGFGRDGVWTALGNGDGTFQDARLVLARLRAQRQRLVGSARHPRFLADVTGDGRADIVGFGDDDVYVALARGRRHFPGTRLGPGRPRLQPGLADRAASAVSRRHHRRRPGRHRRPSATTACGRRSATASAASPT